MLDVTHIKELEQISNSLTTENIGDSYQRALVIQAAIGDSYYWTHSEVLLQKIRAFARKAELGWKILAAPPILKNAIREQQPLQIVALVSILQELLYAFERIQEAALSTFENSAPVRFYINGIFHYVTALFLLDWKDNKKAGLPYPGTVISVLHPLGLDELLAPIYGVLNRPFGSITSYGDTILKNRNKQFVHSSFSPDAIKALVADTNIFDEAQKVKFVQYHWDLYNRLFVLRLQLISILTAHDVKLEEYSRERLYGTKI